MFRARTVFVIGAGASFEVGLPIGSELLIRIARALNFSFDRQNLKTGDSEILQALKIILNEGREAKALNEHILSAHQLRRSAKQGLSIDNIIEALEDDKVELVGKLGIAKIIIEAENGSRFFKHENGFPDRLDFSKFSECWYGSLVKVMTENLKKSDIPLIFDNIEIVNFNYDRCLEHFLPLALAEYYGVDPNQFRELMPKLKMHRPYGRVGRLPWQAGDGPAVPFGRSWPEDIASVANQIRTFSETIEDGEELEEIRTAMETADRIIFLGFAFHRQNLRLIAREIPLHTEILATAYNISESDKNVIRRQLADVFEIDGLDFLKDITLTDLTCDGFFRDYWRTITSENNAI